jgi:hypothetical protein
MIVCCGRAAMTQTPTLSRYRTRVPLSRCVVILCVVYPRYRRFPQD